MPSVQITYECYFMEKCNFCSRIKKSLSPKLTAFKNRIRNMGRGEKGNDQGETGATTEHQGKESKAGTKSEKGSAVPSVDASTERQLTRRRVALRARIAAFACFPHEKSNNAACMQGFAFSRKPAHCATTCFGAAR